MVSISMIPLSIYVKGGSRVMVSISMSPLSMYVKGG